MALGDIDEKKVVRDEVTHQHKVPLENTLEYKFCTTTSCHGLSNVMEARRTWVRTFWVLTVLTAFTLLVWQIITLSQQYTAYEAVTEFSINRTNGLEFPAVTICNYNRFKESAILEVSRNLSVDPSAFWKYLAFSLRVNSRPSDDDFLAVKEVQTNLTRALGKGNVDIKKLIQSVSYKLQDMIPMWKETCYWLGNNSGPCSKEMFVPILTQHGCCWSFNFGTAYDSSRVQELSGSENGLNLMVYLDPNEYSEQYGSDGNTQRGIRLLVHGSKEYPTLDTDMLAMSPGVYSYVSMKATRDIRTGSPWGSCGEQKLSSFSEYSEDNCYTELLVNYLRRKCGCVPVALIETATDTDRACSPLELFACAYEFVNFYESDDFLKADCLVDCDTTRYDSTVSFADNPNIFKEQLKVDFKKETGDAADYLRFSSRVSNGHVNRNSVLQIEIYFQRLKVNVMKQKPGKSFESLLADIGGQLGLFIGASVVTLCEFIEYFIVKCNIMWRYHKTKRRMKQQRDRTDHEAINEKKAGLNTVNEVDGKMCQNNQGNSVRRATFL